MFKPRHRQEGRVGIKDAKRKRTRRFMTRGRKPKLHEDSEKKRTSRRQQNGRFHQQQVKCEFHVWYPGSTGEHTSASYLGSDMELRWPGCMRLRSGPGMGPEVADEPQPRKQCYHTRKLCDRPARARCQLYTKNSVNVHEKKTAPRNKRGAAAFRTSPFRAT